MTNRATRRIAVVLLLLLIQNAAAIAWSGCLHQPVSSSTDSMQIDPMANDRHHHHHGGGSSAVEQGDVFDCMSDCAENCAEHCGAPTVSNSALNSTIPVHVLPNAHPQTDCEHAVPNSLFRPPR